MKQLQEKDDDVKEIRIVDLRPYKNKLGNCHESNVTKLEQNITDSLCASL